MIAVALGGFRFCRVSLGGQALDPTSDERHARPAGSSGHPRERGSVHSRKLGMVGNLTRVPRLSLGPQVEQPRLWSSGRAGRETTAQRERMGTSGANASCVRPSLVS